MTVATSTIEKPASSRNWALTSRFWQLVPAHSVTFLPPDFVVSVVRAQTQDQQADEVPLLLAEVDGEEERERARGFSAQEPWPVQKEVALLQESRVGWQAGTKVDG